MTIDDDELCDNDLHIAVRLGDIEATRDALKDGFHPDTIGLFEWNSLHEAASNGDVDILKLLLKYAANPNKHDNLNSNTALHYAAAEEHAECLRLLLEKGGDASIRNDKGESPVDMATSNTCKEVLEEYGYVCQRVEPLKSILKSSKNKLSETSNEKTKSRPRPTISTSPDSWNRKNVSTSSSFDSDDRVSSPISIDSGTFSPYLKSLTSLKETWDGAGDGFLRTPSSPTRSQGSSYGSMTSLGSSSCSAIDDCAGQFVLSFQYNSKKQEFKVRMWEILLTTLLSPSRMPKDTNMHLYLKSTIVPDDEYKPNPSLRRKSEVFRLQSGEHIVAGSENQCPMSLCWSDKIAKMDFKNSLSLEYTNVTKQIVASSSIQMCLCIRPKRSFMSTKSKSHPHDPVLASMELRMSDAVRRLMKEMYDTERHDVLGITRQAFPLDAVVSEKHGRENQSFNSDPSVRIRMSSLAIADNLNRSASVGDLQKTKSSTPIGRTNHDRESKTDLTSEEGRDSGIDKTGTYSTTSLDSVLSHSSITNPQVQIRLPLKKISNRFASVAVGQAEESMNEEGVKVSMPHPNNSVYREFKRKQAGEKGRGRAAQKTRTKLKSGSRVLISTATSAMRPNSTTVFAFDDEEMSVGNPSEESVHRSRFEGNVSGHHRTLSTGSLVEVDESPSPSRHRRRYHHHTVSQTPPKTAIIPHSHKSLPKTNDWSLDIDPRDTKVDMTDLKPNLDKLEKSASRTNTKPKDVIEMTSLPAKVITTHQRTMHNSSRHKVSRQSALRKLVYDESDLTGGLPSDNPCYVND